MRIRLAIPDELDDQERKEALNAALEAVTVADTALVRRGIVPTAKKAIQGMGIRWKPEPPGDEHFDLATTVVGRKWGDCDDLAPYYAGSLRASGTDPQARAFVRRSGPNRWHALVRRGDGSIEDPSRHAGMGQNVSGEGDGGTAAAIHHPMSAEPRLCIAIRGTPDNRHWFARVDVPDGYAPWSWTSIAANQNPRKALQSAVKSARAVVGDALDEEDDFRLASIHDLAGGADPYEVAEALVELAGNDVDVLRVVLDGVHSVGFLDSITRPFRKLVAPITRPLARAYDTVSPYTSVMFPGAAQMIESARAASTGDPMAFYKSRVMPGVQSGRDVFERNPLGRVAHPILAKTFGAIPGANQWFAAAAPRAPGGAPQEAPQSQAFPQLQLPPGVDPRELLALLLGQGGNAPPTSTYERGAVVRPQSAGPSFMRF